MLLALLLLAQAAVEAGRPTPASLGRVPADGVHAFLVRHGQAFSNLDPAPPLPPEKLDRLTALGHNQARRAGEALRAVRLERILTSPAGRARETAQDLAALLGLPVEVEPRLRPLELGQPPEGQADAWDWRIAEWQAGRDPVPPGGESMQELGRRVLDLVASLAAAPGRSVVLVAHSEVIAAFVGELSGVPAAQRWPPAVPNGSITAVEARAGQRPRVLFASQLPPPPR
jgi:broad specificity phosphatase PhoE